MKPNIHSHSQLLQPVGPIPAQASAAAPTCMLTSRTDDSKSGLARGKKRHRAEHSLSQQQQQQQVEETPVEDPDTPDLEEVPPQAFKRRKKEQRDGSMDGGKVKIGDVVWAKCGNYPWWPAQVTFHVCTELAAQQQEFYFLLPMPERALQQPVFDMEKFPILLVFFPAM